MERSWPLGFMKLGTICERQNHNHPIVLDYFISLSVIIASTDFMYDLTVMQNQDLSFALMYVHLCILIAGPHDNDALFQTWKST